jgi:hypothetical protein
MGAILARIISKSTAILKHLFALDKPGPANSSGRPEAGKRIYKSIVNELKVNPGFPAYRSDLKLLHRRLAQYQRLRIHGSPDASTALKKLEKQWRRVQRNSMRRIKSLPAGRRGGIRQRTDPPGQTGKIIPISRACRK